MRIPDELKVLLAYQTLAEHIESRERFEADMDMYIVKMADGATFCSGPQKGNDGQTIQGGVMLFETRDLALEESRKWRGSRIETRTLDYATKRAEELNINLWIRWSDGGHSYIETSKDLKSGRLIRIGNEYDGPDAA